MEENNQKDIKFTIINDNGEELECDVLFTVDSDETKKSYIVYTDNSTDEEGNIKTYASIYDPTGESLKLEPIETEQEWDMIEKILTSAQEKASDPTNEEKTTN
ncbi:MAG: DUF1292 domain-containing protein [Mollicutes bacterium]|jgi:uncharacterized protein YrzB (UPF0473 family)|nr:DUF1292 domain-containing protein [Mollicutes bacterium]